MRNKSARTFALAAVAALAIAGSAEARHGADDGVQHARHHHAERHHHHHHHARHGADDGPNHR